MADRADKPRSRRRPPPQRPAEPDAKARADQLHKDGLPYQMAMAVAHGKLELNDALERMATKERVTRLMEKHDLSRALATQVAIGHADLDQVLARRRRDAHREENRLRTCLVEGGSLALAIHGGSLLKGTVLSNDSFSFRFEDEKQGEIEVHKLDAKFGYDPADWKRVKKAVKLDRKVRAAAERPPERPQDRYSVSDKRLFGLFDSEREVSISLLDGEQIRGRVAWFGRYELGLTVRGDVTITVFRHALSGIAAL